MQACNNYGVSKYPVLITRLPEYAETLNPLSYIFKNNPEKCNQLISTWNCCTEAKKNLILGVLFGHISFESRDVDSENMKERIWVKFNHKENPYNELFKNIISLNENAFVLDSSFDECNFVMRYCAFYREVTHFDLESNINRIKYELQIVQIQDIVEKLNQIQLQIEVDQCIEKIL